MKYYYTTIILFLLSFITIFSQSADISIISVSGGGHYCKGEQIVLLCKAKGDNLNYSWIKDEVIINNENNPTFVINSADYSNSGIYKCVVSNSETSLESSAELVYIDNETGFITQPKNNYTFIGQSVSFQAGANVNGSADSYIWYRDNEPLTDLGGKYSGTKSSVLTINNCTIIDTNYSYWCKANGQCNSAESEKAKFVIININTAFQSADTFACWDYELTLYVTPKANAEGVKFKYQWYKDDEPIDGAVSSIYYKENTRLIDEGIYYCKITEVKTNYSIISNIIKVTIRQEPLIEHNFFLEINISEQKSMLYYLDCPDHSKKLIEEINWYCNDTLMPEFHNRRMLRVMKGDKSLTDITSDDDDYFIEYQARFYCIVYYYCGYFKTPVSTLTFLPEDKVITQSIDNYQSEDYYLTAPNPNPVSEISTIRYKIPTAGNVQIILYNELGIQVTVLVDEYLEAGQFNLSINMSKLNLSKGIYFYTMKTSNIILSNTLIIQ